MTHTDVLLGFVIWFFFLLLFGLHVNIDAFQENEI